MPTSNAVPFKFDTTFDVPENMAPKRVQKRTLTLEEIAQIEQKAFDAGVASTQDSQLVQLSRAADRVMNSVHELNGRVRESLDQAYAEASALSFIIARKLADVALSNFPQADIEALIAQCLEEQKGEPAIVLRVNDELLDPIKDAAARLKESRGFEGKIAIIGEPQIAPGDCAIEWTDGGLNRDFKRALQEIEAIIKGYMCADEADGAPDLFAQISDDIKKTPGEEA